MFASLELASILRKAEWNAFTGGHLTYTFAAPRVGNSKFARLYNLAFPETTDHWALQRSNDAIPHLPFAAWGFKHPYGVAFIEPSSQTAPAPPSAIRRTGDRGDDLSKLRPNGNQPINWVEDHDISAYLEPLQDLLTLSGADEDGLRFSA